MKIFHRISWLVVLVAGVGLIMTGCLGQEKRADGSSIEKMKSSVAEMREGMTADNQKKFDEAMKVIAFSKIDMKGMMVGTVNEETMKSDMLRDIDGKTATEIISKADSILKARRDKEREQALIYINELEAKRASAESDRKKLENFKVLKSRFYKQTRQYSYMEKPIIEITVRNDTGHAVSRAYFKGTIASPGRSVPWLVEEFNYTISGGVEPGEEQSWSLAPNMFGEWGKVGAPADAVFTVEVIKLNDSEGNTLFSSQGLSEYEEKMLASYKEEYL